VTKIKGMESEELITLNNIIICIKYKYIPFYFMEESDNLAYCDMFWVSQVLVEG
jgi:hypothetical protein